MNRPTGLPAVGGGDHQLRLAGAVHVQLGVFIDIAISMTGDGNGLFPGGDNGVNPLHHHRGAENRAVQQGADGAVGAFPHLLEMIFLHPLGVGGDGGAFHAHPQLFDGLGRIHRYPVVGFIPMRQSQVIVIGFQLHKGQQQLLLDRLPNDPGHLVAVHLHQRGAHLDLFHNPPAFPRRRQKRRM